MCKFLLQCSNGKLENFQIEEPQNLFPIKNFKNDNEFIENLHFYNELPEFINDLKIILQKYQQQNELDFSVCIPAYIRYLGDRLFYRIIENGCVNYNQNYLEFWELAKSKNIQILIHSTLFGWINYDDFIPYYSAPISFWKYGLLNKKYSKNLTDFYNLLSDSTNNIISDAKNKIYGTKFGKNPEEIFTGRTDQLRQKAKWFVKKVNECNCNNL